VRHFTKEKGFSRKSMFSLRAELSSSKVTSIFISIIHQQHAHSPPLETMEELDAEEKAFQNKFSRQIATMGLAAVRKLVKMKVLIVGCGGVGAETAKNVILQGTRAVTLYDPVRRVACHHQVFTI
jgi:alanine dehydrogenase